MSKLVTMFCLLLAFSGTYAQENDFFGINAALGLNPAGSNVAAPQPAAVGPAAPRQADGEAVPAGPQTTDYRTNLASDVFGANLFTGAFSRQGTTQFNPDYAVATGDRIQLRLWGGFEYDAILQVDPKGNVFIPHVGPVQLLGVRNRDIQRVVESSVRKVFRANVYSYASLAAAQPVRVFVSGYVHRPGLYNGTSMDSLLHYLDLAGGIDPERGSFLRVEIKRGEQVRATVDLYRFLLDGVLPLVQFSDGDVIFVTARQNTVKVTGLAENARRFEFSDAARTIADMVRLAKPLAQATHVRIIRNTGTVRNIEYFPLADAEKVHLQNGDELDFTADKKPGTITVRVEGEHLSPQEYVLPYGVRMGELIQQVAFSERSDPQSLQLFRRSVKERQKRMLQAALKSLESAALTARSGTSDEARLRKEEADLILQWVDRAREVEPTGQVYIAESSARNELLLENGDILRVPTKDGLVLVSGEVLFPNAIAYDAGMMLEDYIRHAGGYTQNANASRLVIAHRDGSFSEGKVSAEPVRDAGIFWWEDEPATGTDKIRAGDEILVLPRIDVKSRQIAKDLTQILYQIAVSTKVIVGL